MAKEETKLVLFLKSIGISGRYKGFYYLKEAVFLVLQDELSVQGPRKYLPAHCRAQSCLSIQRGKGNPYRLSHSIDK